MHACLLSVWVPTTFVDVNQADTSFDEFEKERGKRKKIQYIRIYTHTYTQTDVHRDGQTERHSMSYILHPWMLAVLNAIQKIHMTVKFYLINIVGTLAL